jgi:hypothetical protein
LRKQKQVFTEQSISEIQYKSAEYNATRREHG